MRQEVFLTRALCRPGGEGSPGRPALRAVPRGWAPTSPATHSPSPTDRVRGLKADAQRALPPKGREGLFSQTARISADYCEFHTGSRPALMKQGRCPARLQARD